VTTLAATSILIARQNPYMMGIIFFSK